MAKRARGEVNSVKISKRSGIEYEKIKKREQGRIALAKLGLSKPTPRETPLENLKRVLG